MRPKLFKTEKARSLVAELLDLLISKYYDGTGIVIDPTAKLIQKEIRSICNNLDEGVLLEVLVKLKRHSGPYIELFEDYYEDVLSEHANSLWEVFIPVNISYPDKKIQVGTTTFGYVETVELPKLDEIKRFPHNPFSEIKETNKRRRYLSCKTTGSNPLTVWNEIVQEYNVLRGILDFIRFKGMFHYVGNSTRSEQTYPSYVIFRFRDSFMFIDTQIKREQHHELSIYYTIEEAEVVDNLLLFLSDFGTDEKSIAWLLKDCFRLYAEAMNAADISQTFLRLWQVAEEITLSQNTGGGSEKVIARIGWHLAESDLEFKDLDFTLNSIRNARNVLVHRGISVIDSDDVNLLKALCEQAIGWLIESKDSMLSVGQLEYFYQIRTISKRRKSDMIAALNFVDEKNR